MPTIHKTEIVPYSCEQMYMLVDNIEQYKEFVPWCVGSDELQRTEDEVRATLTFSAKGIQKSFTTLNRLRPHRMMELRLIDGPFHQLEGFWRFEEQPDHGCKVVLDLEFEFSNKLLALMFGPVFHQVASTLVSAFTERADEVYAK